METKMVRKFKWLWAWQDEQEEAWLGEMSRGGLHLANAPFAGFYNFRPGEPRNYTYRLDYKTSGNRDKDAYLQLFSDAGWEYISEMAGWQYFRKETSPGEEAEIFSDPESKIAKYKRVLAYVSMMSPLMLIFLVMMDSDRVFERALSLVFVGFMLLFAYAAYMLMRRIKELEKQRL